MNFQVSKFGQWIGRRFVISTETSNFVSNFRLWFLFSSLPLFPFSPLLPRRLFIKASSFSSSSSLFALWKRKGEKRELLSFAHNYIPKWDGGIEGKKQKSQLGLQKKRENQKIISNFVFSLLRIIGWLQRQPWYFGWKRGRIISSPRLLNSPYSIHASVCRTILDLTREFVFFCVRLRGNRSFVSDIFEPRPCDRRRVSFWDLVYTVYRYTWGQPFTIPNNEEKTLPLPPWGHNSITGGGGWLNWLVGGTMYRKLALNCRPLALPWYTLRPPPPPKRLPAHSRLFCARDKIRYIYHTDVAWIRCGKIYVGCCVSVILSPF